MICLSAAGCRQPGCKHLTINPGICFYHQGRILSAFKIHGPATIGVLGFMGYIEMATFITVWS
jgi:hypothetical protein